MTLIGHEKDRLDGLMLETSSLPIFLEANETLDIDIDPEILDFDAHFDRIWEECISLEGRELSTRLRELERTRDWKTGRRIVLIHTINMLDYFSYLFVAIINSVAVVARSLRKKTWRLNRVVVFASLTCGGMICSSLVGLGPLQFHFETLTGKAPARASASHDSEARNLLVADPEVAALVRQASVDIVGPVAALPIGSSDFLMDRSVYSELPRRLLQEEFPGTIEMTAVVNGTAARLGKRRRQKDIPSHRKSSWNPTKIAAVSHTWDVGRNVVLYEVDVSSMVRSSLVEEPTAP